MTPGNPRAITGRKSVNSSSAKVNQIPKMIFFFFFTWSRSKGNWGCSNVGAVMEHGTFAAAVDESLRGSSWPRRPASAVAFVVFAAMLEGHAMLSCQRCRKPRHGCNHWPPRLWVVTFITFPSIRSPNCYKTLIALIPTTTTTDYWLNTQNSVVCCWELQ